jgi:hypothetical protein
MTGRKEEKGLFEKRVTKNHAVNAGVYAVLHINEKRKVAPRNPDFAALNRVPIWVGMNNHRSIGKNCFADVPRLARRVSARGYYCMQCNGGAGEVIK